MAVAVRDSVTVGMLEFGVFEHRSDAAVAVLDFQNAAALEQVTQNAEHYLLVPHIDRTPMNSEQVPAATLRSANGAATVDPGCTAPKIVCLG